MSVLKRDFYERDTKIVARALLGKMLARKIGRVTLGGMIVETEAYCGREDSACHAHRGQTASRAESRVACALIVERQAPQGLGRCFGPDVQDGTGEFLRKPLPERSQYQLAGIRQPSGDGNLERLFWTKQAAGCMHC